MASVIKGKGRKKAAPSAAAGPSVPADERSAVAPVSDQAQAIIDDAHRHHKDLIAHANEDVVQMVEAAAAKGEEEGTAQAQHMRAEVAQLEQRMLAEIENEVVRTALRVAEEILSKEVKQNEMAVVNIAAQALSSARDAKEVFLRVHPRHSAALRANKARLIDVLRSARDVSVREDKKVKAGGVLIQTEAGVIDAQLDTQLEEMGLLLGT